MMTLDNMRENGTRHVAIWCNCGHHANVLVDDLPGDTAVPMIRLRFKCSACGAKPFQSRPAWDERTDIYRPPEDCVYFKGPASSGDLTMKEPLLD